MQDQVSLCSILVYIIALYQQPFNAIHCSMLYSMNVLQNSQG